MKLYKLIIENGRLKILYPNGTKSTYSESTQASLYIRAEKTIAKLNEPIYLARIAELEAMLNKVE